MQRGRIPPRLPAYNGTIAAFDLHLVKIMDGQGRVDLEFGMMGDSKKEGVKVVRVERADVQAAKGKEGGVMRGEEKSGGMGQETQGKCTSDSKKEGDGQRAAYSYQLFKHIPLCTETLQSEYMMTSAITTNNSP